MAHKCVLLILCTLLASCYATTYCYLDVNGNSTGTCTTTDKPCTSIQQCLNQYTGDLIISLSAGTYNWSGNCNIAISTTANISSLVIQASPSNNVIIDCNSQFSHFRFAGIPAITISGLTLKNGFSKQDGGCIFARNISNFVLQTVSFSNCQSQQLGGALYTDAPAASILDSTFIQNSALGGGAIYLSNTNLVGGPTVSKSYIANNTAESGGGVYIYGEIATITNSNITFNNASNGGGVYFNSDQPAVVGAYNFLGTTISNNVALDEGGGIYVANTDHSWNVYGVLLSQNFAGDQQTDPNVACDSTSASFCYSCTAKDCVTGCAAGVNQSCSQTTLVPNQVFCYTNKTTTCATADACSCDASSGLSKSAKILIVLIAICMFVGLILILADVIRYFIRKNQRGYTPIK